MSLAMPDEPLTVLVLGVGGNVSQGIMKALANGSLQVRVLAGCISPSSMGLYLAERSWVTPRADDPAFLPWLEDLCREEAVHAVLSGAEPVLDVLAQHAEVLAQRTGAVCVVSPPTVLEVGRDKLRTASWLAEQGLAGPQTADACDRAGVQSLAERCGFPLVAKPRRGKGAQGVSLVSDSAELSNVVGRPGFVVQQHLDGDEFSVGCMCDSAGEVQGAFAMRRELRDGTTFRAEAGDFPDVEGYAREVASRLRPLGPLNVQLRVGAGGPAAFELNVRFSGTTPMRARLGFQEVEAALRHQVLGQPMRVGKGQPGTVLRYWNELYLPADRLAEMQRAGQMTDPGHGVEVEDWGA